MFQRQQSQTTRRPGLSAPMSQTSGPVTFPRQLADILRPELPALVEEIITEIRRLIPEYARPLDGPYGRVMRLGATQVLSTFVDLVTDPYPPCDSRDHICRKLGEYEAIEVRSLDSLQTAYRVGAHIAYRRAAAVASAHHYSAEVIHQLADAAFAYVNDVASLSIEGYLLAKSEAAQSHDEGRRRLLRLILEQPAVPLRAIEELAQLTSWLVPSHVTVIVTERPAPAEIVLPFADVLADLCSAEPHLLAPGELNADQRAALEAAPWHRRRRQLALHQHAGTPALPSATARASTTGLGRWVLSPQGGPLTLPLQTVEVTGVRPAA